MKTAHKKKQLALRVWVNRQYVCVSQFDTQYYDSYQQ